MADSADQTSWRFDSRSTADEVVAGLDLGGKRVIVTGANTGIGFEAARALASVGAQVILACRNAESAVRAADHIRAAHPKAEVQVAILDLASVPSIQSFCDGLEMSSVDVLICNAGIVATAYDETEFGFERTVGVCHFGHFLLVKRLLPKLLAGRDSRVVMVASESHRTPKQLDFDNFPLTRSNFSIMTSYGQAKLCNVLMANELGRRYGAEGLTACSVHPGNLVTTEIGRGSFVMRLVMKLVSPFTKTPNQGAATTVLCATHPVASDLDGKYFNHCKPQRSSPEANDPGVAVRLWEISEQWVRIAS